MVIQIVFFYSAIYTEETKLKDDYLFYSGITLSNSYAQVRLFSELEKLDDTKASYELTSWGAKVMPFDFCSLALGGISYSGVWSRLNNPEPNKIAPLKQKYSIQKRLLSTLPSITSSEKPLSIEFNLDLPFVHIQAFSSVSPELASFGGIGTSFPFTLFENKDKPDLQISGRWTTAWKISKLHAKEYDSWFVDTKPFLDDYYHSMVSELALRVPFNTILLSAGLSQNPFGNPLGFFRGEYSLQVNPFLLNAQLFMCDIDYFGQDGRYQKDTFQASLNPQLRFNYYSGFIRSFKLGGTARVELQNGNTFFEETKWLSFFDIASELQCIFLTLHTSVSLSEILITSKEKNIKILLQNNSNLKIQTILLFRPWYLEIIDRVWSVGCGYETEISKLAKNGDFIINIKLSTKAQINEDLLINSNFYGESDFSQIDPLKETSIILGGKINLEYKIKFVKSNQKLRISAQSEFRPKTKSIKSEFSISFAIDAGGDYIK